MREILEERGRSWRCEGEHGGARDGRNNKLLLDKQGINLVLIMTHVAVYETLKMRRKRTEVKKGGGGGGLRENKEKDDAMERD